MSFGRIVLAAFIGGLLAILFVLAWRASKETGKSIPASLPDVPGEAQRLASDVKSRATEAAADVKSRTTEAISTRLEGIREKEAAIKERIVGGRNAEDGEVAAAAEQL